MALAQQKKVQLSFNTNLIDAYAAAEINLSANSTLYTAIGFGAGSVSSIDLHKYFDKSKHNQRGTDVVLPDIFFAPYFNIQYRNYFARKSDERRGAYTGHNSGLYVGARLKMYTAPAFVLKEEVKPMKENYTLGAIFGYQKAVGAKRKLLFNINGGVSTHANYNLSFFAWKPMLHTSIGYILSGNK
ncbi:hypothetical protein AQF98_09175 [Pedobacter sp. Hv1]|nr:hypothetical protein AQF98_09175 [Pedobacter sp. Hv1]